MWKFLIFVLVTTSCGSLFGQKSDQGQARLVSTFHKGDFLHANNEAALDLRAFADMPGDKVAVRICSNEPLALALATASGRPFLLASNLTNHGFPGENILFLRSKSCETHDPRIAITEFWAVPKGAALPPFVESINSTQAKVRDLMPRGEGNKQQSLRKQIEELTAYLQARPDAWGIVAGYYLKKPSSNLRKSLGEARALLGQSGSTSDRTFVRSLPWTGTIDANDKEPDFPDILVVEMKRDCNQP